MVGQGVLRECLGAGDVALVQAIGRRATGQHHPKLREIVRQDLLDYGAIESELKDFDACFFCLGVSSFRKTEAEYARCLASSLREIDTVADRGQRGHRVYNPLPLK